jgi:cytochrome c-type protein NapC
VGLLLIAGIGVGVVGWGGFNWALELTNTEQFCISCHEMRDNVYQELQKTIHWSNRTGVRATCPDCHVPRPWIYKIIRKIQASNEVYHKIMGTVATPELFDAKRLELAKDVWAAMKSTDSRECRNCHAMQSMDLARQQPRARGSHESAMKDGNTCIDCHKGIAHKPVHQLLEKEKPASSEENFDVN